MASHTAYLSFQTEKRREFVRITDDVQAAVDESRVREGMVLVSAMHITAGVWVNDDEPGILEDTLEWLDKLAPPSWKAPANDAAAALSPDPGDFRHHRGGEDNGDAHWKNLLVHHQVILPWSADDTEEAAWLYRKLAPPARALFDLLMEEPGKRHAGNELASALSLEKGAHGVAGILAWPGRYCRKLGRDFPIATEGRDDGGTDYFMEPELAAIFAEARGLLDAR